MYNRLGNPLHVQLVNNIIKILVTNVVEVCIIRTDIVDIVISAVMSYLNNMCPVAEKKVKAASSAELTRHIDKKTF